MRKILLAKGEGIPPEAFDFRDVMEDVANQAWKGSGLNTRQFQAVGSNSNISLVFYGHVYEPTYEYFTSGCNVYAIKENGEKQCLYAADKNNLGRYRKTNIKAYAAITRFLQKNMKIVVEVTHKCS